MEKLKPGKYRHYKGKLYEVIGVGRHSETKEELVFYRALYEDKEFGNNALWARPLGMFLNKVVVDGRQVSRFERVENS